jgi:hypothetical protein
VKSGAGWPHSVMKGSSGIGRLSIPFRGAGREKKDRAKRQMGAGQGTE